MTLASDAAAAIKVNESSPRVCSPRKPFWRFSLASLLLVTALGMTIISHVNTSQELAQQRRESYRLEVGASDRIYIHKLPQTSFSVWQWRAHIPQKHHFRINVATSEVASEGFPRPEAQDVIGFDGEVTINLIQHKTDAKSPSSDGITVTLMHNNSTRESAFIRLPAGAGAGGTITQLAGVDQTESFSTQEPVALLRKTGLLVWIDEVPPVDPGWKRMENPYFSFEIPQGMTKVPIMSEDSFMESYVSTGMELNFDYGMYSAKPRGWPNSATYENLTIDGRVAQIVMARRVHRVGFPFTTQLYVDVNGNYALSMLVYCRTENDVQQARKTFESIHLKPQDEGR